MPRTGKTVSNSPASSGQILVAGDIIGDPNGGCFVVVKQHMASIPPNGYPKGYSDDFVHYSTGYAATGDGPAFVGSINGRNDGTR